MVVGHYRGVGLGALHLSKNRYLLTLLLYLMQFLNEFQELNKIFLNFKIYIYVSNSMFLQFGILVWFNQFISVISKNAHPLYLFLYPK